MKAPRFKKFTAEDFKGAPQWFLEFLTPLSEALSDIVAALSGRLTRSDNFLSKAEPISFTTAATAANTFPLRYKNKLGAKVSAASVWSFAKKNGTAPAAAWSVTIIPNQNDELELTFQGLENATDYVGVLIYEA